MLSIMETLNLKKNISWITSSPLQTFICVILFHEDWWICLKSATKTFNYNKQNIQTLTSMPASWYFTSLFLSVKQPSLLIKICNILRQHLCLSSNCTQCPTYLIILLKKWKIKARSKQVWELRHPFLFASFWKSKEPILISVSS